MSDALRSEVIQHDYWDQPFHQRIVGARVAADATSTTKKDRRIISKTTIAAAIAAALCSNGAFSQDDAPAVSRAAIKAETRAAEKAGKLTPAGEGMPSKPLPYFSLDQDSC